MSELPAAIPLDIRPLLSPYKKHGRLLVKVEQMQPLARLSAGRNNGDNSWSLWSDELDELCYLSAVKVAAPHMLIIRIVDADSAGASTLAVLDYLISPDRAGPAATVEEKGADATAALDTMRHDAEDRLAALESELAAARAEAEMAHTELARERDARQVEQGREIAAAEQRASDRINAEYQAWTREAKENLARAEQHWKAGEAARLAAAEALWQERTDGALAKARAETVSAGDEGRAETGRLREELSVLEGRLAERDAEVAALRSASAEDRARMEQEFHASLIRAREDWKADEETRFAATEAQWRAETKRLFADAAAQAGNGKRVERNRLDEELAALNERLAERDGEVAQLRSQIENDRARQTREFEEAQTRDEQDRKTSEAALLADAKARWREETEKTSAALEQTLAERDRELERMRERLAQTERRASSAADDAGRFEHLSSQLDEATARYREAEAALAAIRRQNQPHGFGGAAHPNDEIENLRAMLTHAEHELEHLRSASSRAGHDLQQNTQKRAQTEASADNGRSLIRDIAVVVTVLMAATIFAPQIVARLPYEWQAALPAFLVGSQSAGVVPASPKPAPKPAVTARSVLPVAVVIKTVNLRAGPSVRTEIVSTLANGTDVAEIGRHGGWVHVLLQEEGGALRKGWVYDSYLKLKTGGAQPATHDVQNR